MNAMTYYLEIWLPGFIILSIISNHGIWSIDYSDYCYMDLSVDGLITLNCSTLNPKQAYTSVSLPKGADKTNLQVIYIAPPPEEPDKTTVVDIMAVYFPLYQNLKEVIIKNNVIITLNVGTFHFKDMYTIFYTHNLERTFQECDNLETLHIESCQFYEKIQFKLPKNLKVYNMAGNLYKNMEIKGSSKLIEVNVNNNPLDNVPHFIDPIPPVNTLRLKGCPLTMMTILDLAPLCQLSLLELAFPSGNRLVTSEGYCNCTILLDYAKEISLKVDSITCYEPKEKITCPSSEYLDKAWEIRKNCAGSSISIFLYVFFSILLLLLLGAALVFASRYFNLKEKIWRPPNQPTSIKMEEAEEELKNPTPSEESFVGNITFR